MIELLFFIALVLGAYVWIKNYRQTKNEEWIKKGEDFLNKPRYTFNDNLGDAAKFKHKGLLAIKNKEFNKAWECFHEQKLSYMNHASQHKFNAQETLALDGSVSENLANILRLEKKHKDALIHIIYWVSTSPSTTKSQEKKLISYFNRAKLKAVNISQVNAFITIKPEFREINNQISEWSS